MCSLIFPKDDQLKLKAYFQRGPLWEYCLKSFFHKSHVYSFSLVISITSLVVDLDLKHKKFQVQMQFCIKVF